MHYTSFGALRSIVETGRFRLYNADGMDDRSEGLFIFEIMGITDPNHPIIKLVKENVPGGSEVFIGSLVTKSNNKVGDDLMWRTYGKGSKGAALVFDQFSDASFADILGKAMQSEQFRNSTSDPAITPVAAEELILCRVYYGRKKQTTALLAELGEQVKQLQVEKMGAKARSLVRMLLDSVRFLFKKDIFSREQEARLVVRRPTRQPGDDSGPAVVKNEFPRTYIECPHIFQPRRIILGSAVKKQGASKKWIKDQQWIREGRQDIDIMRNEEDS